MEDKKQQGNKNQGQDDFQYEILSFPPIESYVPYQNIQQNNKLEPSKSGNQLPQLLQTLNNIEKLHEGVEISKYEIQAQKNEQVQKLSPSPKKVLTRIVYPDESQKQNNNLNIFSKNIIQTNNYNNNYQFSNHQNNHSYSTNQNNNNNNNNNSNNNSYFHNYRQQRSKESSFHENQISSNNLKKNPVQDQDWSNISSFSRLNSSNVLQIIARCSDNFQKEKIAFQEINDQNKPDQFMKRYMDQMYLAQMCIIGNSFNQEKVQTQFNKSKQGFLQMIEKCMNNSKYIREILQDSKLPNKLKDSSQQEWKVKNEERKKELDKNAKQQKSDSKLYKQFLKFLSDENKYSVHLDDLINPSLYIREEMNNGHNTLISTLKQKLSQFSIFADQSNSQKSTPRSLKLDFVIKSIRLAMSNLEEAYILYQNELKIDNSFHERLIKLQSWLSYAETLDMKLADRSKNIKESIQFQVEEIINSPYSMYRAISSISKQQNPVYLHYINKIAKLNQEIESFKKLNPLLISLYNCKFSTRKQEVSFQNKINNLIKQLNQAHSSQFIIDGINIDSNTFSKLKQDNYLQLIENELYSNGQLMQELQAGELSNVDLLIFYSEISNIALINLRIFEVQVKEQNEKEVDIKEQLNSFKFDSKKEIQFVKQIPQSIPNTNTIFFELDQNLYPVKVLFPTNSQDGRILQEIGKEPITQKLISLLSDVDFKQKGELVAQFLLQRNIEGSFLDLKEFVMILSERTQNFEANASDFKQLQSQPNDEEEAKDELAKSLTVEKKEGTGFIKKITISHENWKKSILFFPGFKFALAENEFFIGQSSIIDEILLNKYVFDKPLTRLSMMTFVELIKESKCFDQQLFKSWIQSLSEKIEKLNNKIEIELL